VDLKVQSTHSERVCSFTVLNSKKNSGKIIDSASIVPQPIHDTNELPGGKSWSIIQLILSILPQQAVENQTQKKLKY
jgi:hypothetical protein